MGFQFSLAAVLRVRGVLEEREERMLQKILHEISQTLDKLARVAEEIAETDAMRCAEIFRPINGLDLHASYGQVQELKQRRKNLEGQIEKLDQLRVRQVAVYEVARRNHEMLTDMREEKLGIYESDVTRLEQKALDDNYIARRGHR